MLGWRAGKCVAPLMRIWLRLCRLRASGTAPAAAEPAPTAAAQPETAASTSTRWNLL